VHCKEPIWIRKSPLNSMNKPIACGSHEWEMTMHEFRRMAAAMDLRIRQLTAEGVHGLAAMAALLVTAATLERSYQEALDSDKSPEWRLQMNELNKLHRKWVADLEHFTSVLKRSDVPKKTVDIFVDAFDPMAKRIAQMQTRAMTGD
ncbi:MAG TPA: hypothetical protein VI386_04250, partial [Candidatus Sulfotelmatobacter sp.]